MRVARARRGRSPEGWRAGVLGVPRGRFMGLRGLFTGGVWRRGSVALGQVGHSVDARRLSNSAS
eukprot:8748098-Lingulodinium_polyedra.AAC.1